MGHARALLSLTSPADQLKLREEISPTRVGAGDGRGVQKRAPAALPAAVRRSWPPWRRAPAEPDDEGAPGRQRRRGRIEILYASTDELDRLVGMITKRR